MKKTLLSLVFLMCMGLSVCPRQACAQYPRHYAYYMQMGKSALARKDYEQALEYFTHAHLAQPDSQEVLSFINLLNRMQQQRVEYVPTRARKNSMVGENLRPIIDFTREKGVPKPPRAREKRVPESSVPVIEGVRYKETPSTVDYEDFDVKKIPVPEYIPPVLEDEPEVSVERRTEKVRTERKRAIDAAFRQQKKHVPERKDVLPAETSKRAASRTQGGAAPATPKDPILLQPIEPIYLNSALWARQPKTRIQIEIGKKVTLEGDDIDRFLVVTPGFISIEKEDRDHISITAEKRGETFVHIWDDTGRWTFSVETIFPIIQTSQQLDELLREVPAPLFQFSYSADWGSYYNGQAFNALDRASLNFTQWLGVSGYTPYGDVDGSLVYNKFDASTELTGYTVGLTDGQIGNFKDFSIRGFDASKNLSDLTLPGQYFRGILFDAQAFDHVVEYTYLRGKNRSTFGFLAPGILEELDSYIEGGQLRLFPKAKTNITLNFARGFGDDRADFLKERVYSGEISSRLNNLTVEGEYAYDEDTAAKTASAFYTTDGFDLKMKFRDIAPEFSTITSLPSNRGEIGGIVGVDLETDLFDFSALVDIYQDRFLPNAEHPEEYNFDLTTSILLQPTPTDTWNTSVYYITTPQELSPRRNLRVYNRYSKRFSFLGAVDVTAFLGGGYQKSRFSLSSSSDYDRYSFNIGFRLPLIRNLGYYANYEMSWVDEIQSRDSYRPHVFNTGVAYSKKLNDALSTHLSFSYRNEEETNGRNSFLAGEDSITGSMGATYQLTKQCEFFADARARNVWREGENSTAFNEVDVRAGVRSTFDLPFRWNPEGLIQGTVYKDLDNNEVQGPQEQGIEGVRIQVGDAEVVTAEDGYYSAVVNAKRVRVSIDIDTIPNGFVFSTPQSVNQEIIPHKIQKVNFGLTTQSGIYGIVYVDENGNGKPDNGDTYVPGVKISVDETEVVVSDFEGTYFFRNLIPGSHKLRIDVNSILLQYLPDIAITHTVEVVEGTTYVLHIPLRRANN